MFCKIYRNNLFFTQRNEFTEEKTAEFWFSVSKTPKEEQDVILQAFEQELKEKDEKIPESEIKKLTGMRPFRKDNRVWFHHTTVITVGQK